MFALQLQVLCCCFVAFLSNVHGKLSQQLLSALDGLELSHAPEFHETRSKLANKYGLSKQSLSLCYDYRVGPSGEQADIFGEPIKDIVKKLLNEHSDSLRLNTLQKVTEQAQHVPANIAALASRILQCMDKQYWKSGTKLGLSRFTAMSTIEFLALLGLRIRDRLSAPQIECTIPDVEPPAGGFDWRTMNLVTRVKNQGTCGSCYIFAGTATMETQVMKVKYNFSDYQPVEQNNFALSEQDVLNCLSQECYGGFPYLAFQRFIDEGAKEIDDQDDYVAYPETCTTPDEPIKASSFCNEFNDNSFSDDDLKKIVYGYGPVSVGVDADEWQYITNGHFPEDQDCGVQINHAVTLVGWTDDNNWLIKNSWSEQWGDEGYMHLPMGQNKCGVNNFLSAVTL